VELERDMTKVRATRQTAGDVAGAPDGTAYRDRVARRASGAVGSARSGASALLRRAPGVMRATRTGAQGTTSTLQALPDSTLRWLAAGSVGLGAGLYLSGAPRVATAAGVLPALIMGAAMVLRPVAAGRGQQHPGPRASPARG
jgi:hypothetical protein